MALFVHDKKLTLFVDHLETAKLRILFKANFCYQTFYENSWKVVAKKFITHSGIKVYCQK